jgi:hypothetical protein
LGSTLETWIKHIGDQKNSQKNPTDPAHPKKKRKEKN